jgi:hypothetical protein
MDATDRTVLDATLADADWPLVHRLWRLGVDNDQLYALLRLRLAGRDRGNPALDGLADDPRAGFARWLVEQGRLNEGTDERATAPRRAATPRTP